MPTPNFLLKFCAFASIAVVAVQPTSAHAQGAPHLSITAPTYQVLVPPGTGITSSMCRPDNVSCLAAVSANRLLFTSNNIYGMATDTLGNVYTSDYGNLAIVKTSASGTPQILAGQIGTPLTTIAPPSAPASTAAFAFPVALAVDLAGNVYVADLNEVTVSAQSYGSLLRLDPLGTVTRITGDPAQSVIQANSAAASLQAINPQSVATDLADNVYVSDINTCTVREFTPATGLLKVLAGSLTQKCTGATAAPATGEKANTFAFANIQDIAVGNDGTLYITDHDLHSLYSVTPADGVIHLLATSTGSVTAGPASSSGSIGSPEQGLAVDNYGDVFLNSSGSSNDLVEVTAGSGSQVLVLSALQLVSQDSSDFSGEPASYYVDNGYQQLALDPTGRLYVSAPNFDSIVYLDRNSTAVIDSPNNLQQTLTLMNTGTGTLTGVSFAGTGLPYALSPTAAELTAAGLGSSPVVPFAVDTTNDSGGTCLNIFATGTFSLAPGASCTLTIDYDSNSSAPNAGSFTLYTNDPDGPTTVSLSASQVTSRSGNPSVFAATSITVSPAASSTANGSVTINTATTSSVPVFTSGIGVETPATPTGALSIGLTNNATGVQTVQQAAFGSTTSSGYTSASATFTGLAPGTYSLQAVYPGDGTSAASYSAVQTVYVTPRPVDFTVVSSVPYHFPYTGTTAQDVNFSAQAYTNPSAVEFQDLYAGANGTGYAVNLLNFTFLDPNGSPISSNSATPLAAGKYTLVPSVPNASSLGYSVTAHPANFFIDPANLTVGGNYVNVPYGQYYVPAGTTVPSGGTALNLPLTVYTAPPVLSTDEAASQSAPNAISLSATIDGQPTNAATLLPVGHYTVRPSLSGNGAGNYSLTANPAPLVIAPANLTARVNYVRVPYGQYYAPVGTTVPSGGTALNLPMTVFTAPSVLSADEAASPSAPNAITLSAAFDGQPTNVATMLPVGQYTVRPAVSGNGAGNYSLTALPSHAVITPANLTINAHYTNVRYGQVSGTNYAQSNVLETSATTAQTDVTAGRLTIGTTASGTADSLGYLPVGSYTLTPTISGTAAANYSLTANRGPLVVQPADLTLNMASYTATGSLTVNGHNLCAGCYTAPNYNLLTTDPALGISIFITGTGSTSFFNSIALGSGSSVVLGPGTYTVTAGFSVSGPRPNYSITMHPGTLIVH